MSRVLCTPIMVRMLAKLVERPAVLVVILAFALAAGGAGVLVAQDDPDEPTVVRYCGGALPNDCGTGVGRATIPAGEGVDDAVAIDGFPDLFRHVFWVSGPQCCVFTARRVYEDGGSRLVDVGGGRDCGPQITAGEACAYIATGFEVYAVSGRSCTGFGIVPCTGPFCR